MILSVNPAPASSTLVRMEQAITGDGDASVKECHDHLVNRN